VRAGYIGLYTPFVYVTEKAINELGVAKASASLILSVLGACSTVSRSVLYGRRLVARLDGKRPDGLTLIPWRGGKPLTWDVTIVSTLADSHLHSTSHSAGSAAETASIRKETKYSSLPPDFIFQPVAIETLGTLDASAVNFLREVGRRLTSLSGDSRETSFLFQRLSMLIQRFNSALIMDSFCFSDEDPGL